MVPDHNEAQCRRRRSRRRLYAATAAGVPLTAALSYIGLVDPHRADSVYPLCPFKILTGWNCPACGGLRMTHDLLHGNLAAAINDNLVLLIGIPLLAGWLAIRRRQGRPSMPLTAVVTIAVVGLAWTVVRNVPGFPLVPPIGG